MYIYVGPMDRLNRGSLHSKLPCATTKCCSRCQHSNNAHSLCVAMYTSFNCSTSNHRLFVVLLHATSCLTWDTLVQCVDHTPDRCIAITTHYLNYNSMTQSTPYAIPKCTMLEVCYSTFVQIEPPGFFMYIYTGVYIIIIKGAQHVMHSDAMLKTCIGC